MCGRRDGVVPIEGGAVCRYCVPVNATFDMPSAEEVAALHVRDPELLSRIDEFEETESFADLRFDDVHGLFFKGPWPSYCIPVLSYAEIGGYRMIVDGSALAFNSVTGQRALFKTATDEYVRKVSGSMDTIVMELDSSRPNVRFAPYEIRGRRSHVADTREECLRLAIDVARKRDGITGGNAAGGRVRRCCSTPGTWSASTG